MPLAAFCGEFFHLETVLLFWVYFASALPATFNDTVIHHQHFMMIEFTA